MHKPPLLWTIDTNGLARASASFSYTATASELASLRDYLNVNEVKGFTANVCVEPIHGGKYKTVGDFAASLTQASVVNLEPVNNRIEENFCLEFWPSEQIANANEDTLSVDKDRPETLQDDRIAIGSVLSELLSVAIDPYPRNEGETLEWQEAVEAEPGPFAQLERLRRQMRSDGAPET